MSQPRAVTTAATLTAGINPGDLPRLRRRMQWVLVAASALGSTGYLAAVTVGTLAAAEMAGGPALGGLPTAILTIGTATAASLVAGLMLRAGRRPGWLGGLAIGIVGALIAMIAVVLGSIPLLLLGSFLAGFANATINLSRYVSADLVAPERRASAVGIVVWGSAVGAVLGPNLIGPGGTIAVALGLPTLSGSYVLTAMFMAAALVIGFVLLRPEPYALAHPSAMESRPVGMDAPSAVTLLRRPSVLVALVTLVAGQVVMVLIMTMTPLHLIDNGHGLGTVGFVLSAHTFGMFALSPISGRLTDRFGSPVIIGLGLGTLGLAAFLSAVAPVDGGLLLTLALFLLGYGWNLGFVAGSAMLTHGLALGERTRVQGITDTLIWSSASAASLLSGVIVAGASYTALGFLGVVLTFVPVVMLARYGRVIRLVAVSGP